MEIIRYLDWDEDMELLEVELPDERRCGAMVSAYGEELFAEGMAVPQTLDEARGLAWITAEEAFDGQVGAA